MAHRFTRSGHGWGTSDLIAGTAQGTNQAAEQKLLSIAITVKLCSTSRTVFHHGIRRGGIAEQIKDVRISRDLGKLPAEWTAHSLTSRWVPLHEDTSEDYRRWL